ncbi:beta-Amyloid precursor protein binding protein 1 [Carabus blaptoides fortunei]
MSSPAPKSPEQTEKSKKYDRQLRLWGDHGQRALESAKVCLINATALGTETLKSLVLPGIGAFTIIDGKKITEEDIGSNFFLENDSLGLSRAQVATQVLLELNPDVRGDYIDESPEQLLNHNPEFFNSFSLVIATSLPEKVLIAISKKLWELNTPLLLCRSIGFLGYLRIQLREHPIIESHPDNETPDLRLDRPFALLREHMDKLDLACMDLKEHSHVPYLVILYKYLEKWRLDNNGNIPTTYKQKQAFKELIRSGIRMDENGVPLDEENFEEAIRAANVCISSSEVPRKIQNILNDSSCINITRESKPFWIMTRALAEFVENEGQGCLPLKGSLPDMTADTTSYISLQQLYHKQANADTEIVHRRTQQLLQQLGQAQDSITEAEVRLFALHASQIDVIRGSCVADEYSTGINSINDIVNNLENPDSLMVYYVILRGLDRFLSEFNTYPGEFDDQVEPDVSKLKGCISKLLGEWGCQSQSLTKDDYVHEMCRYGGAELHSVSAFLGGCVAQEAIKLITHQYRPVHNVFIYDAITSNTATFML